MERGGTLEGNYGYEDVVLVVVDYDDDDDTEDDYKKEDEGVANFCKSFRSP
jgi:hypothetical protein